MTPIDALKGALQTLPFRYRQALYVLLGLVALVAGACHVLDVSHLGPIAVSKIEDLLVYLAAVFSPVALGNLHRTVDEGPQPEGMDQHTFEAMPPQGFEQ